MPEILVSMLSRRLTPHDVKMELSSRKSQNSLNAQSDSHVPKGRKLKLKNSETDSLTLTLYTFHDQRKQVVTLATLSVYIYVYNQLRQYSCLCLLQKMLF